jgi:plasmid maintenance system antidote protein VapI
MNTEHRKNIADRIGLKDETLWKIVTGRRNASPPVADLLEKITGVPARAWMLGGDVSKRKLKSA